MSEENRRPIKSRDTNFARAGARFCAGLGISPNMISVASVIFAGISCLAYYYAFERGVHWLLLIGAFGIQFRLLCNLFDGMVAVEYQKATPMGEVYNDFPDRIADVLIIMGVGYFVQQNYLAMELAWLSSILAVLTAYIRVLGVSIGTPQFFAGPMAKPHRMFLLTIASITDYLIIVFKGGDTNISILYYSLWVLAVGSIFTCINRLLKIAHHKRNA